MKCKNDIRSCPHNWNDCSYCANLKACESGTYVPETELEESELTVDLSIPIVAEPPVQEIITQGTRGTWAEQFLKMSANDRMKEFYRYKTTNLHSVADPYKAEQGAIVPGGGSKSKNHKKPTRKLPEYMKILGM